MPSLRVIITASCLVALGVAVLSAQPVPTSPPPADKAEAQVVGSAGLAPTSQPATAPATAPVNPYPDVSRARRASTRPAAVPRAMPVNVIADAEVEASIRRGLEVLLAQFDPKTRRLNRPVLPGFEATECGLNALCVYATLQAGLAVGDKRFTPNSPIVVGLLEGTKTLRADRGQHEVYARSLRVLALSVFNREADRVQLTQDTLALVYAHDNGGYRYAAAQLDSQMMPVPRPKIGTGRDWVDHSNTQYGLLGVWAGADAGVDVPKDYWQACVDHWTATQAVNGGWGYIGRTLPDVRTKSRRSPANETTLPMSAAGAASLFVAREWAERADGAFRCGRDALGDPLRAALRAIEAGDLAAGVRDSAHWGYTLYGVERVGLASGFKFIGDADWFRALARQTVDRQNPDGSWKDLIDTGYALLFLSRGRHPILMNKLRVDRADGGFDPVNGDFWANRPHDVDYLARFASKQLERPLNWQVVPVSRSHTDWLDAPILSIGSHQRLRLGEPEVAKLRAYVEAGGMIYTNADADAPGENPKDPLAKFATAGALKRPNEFDRYVTTLAAKLFPDYKLVDLPGDHSIYSSLHKLNPPPKLRGVSNGSRLLLVHSPVDLSLAWQRRDPEKERAAHEAGVNLFVYAAGKRELRYRLDSPDVPDLGPPPTKLTVNVARLKYGGNWSPEPGAWPRFARLFNWKTGTAVALSDVAWQDLKPASAAVATLTGTAAYAPTAKERAATKTFVEGGGVLLVDDCGGAGAFTKAIQPTLAALFAGATFEPVGSDHPLLAGGEPGMADGLQMRLRLWATERKLPPGSAAIKVMRAGKGAVVLCPADLTSGLLGTNTWGVHGYEPAACEAFARNVVLWAADGAK